MALFNFAFARRLTDDDEDTGAFVVPSGSATAVPVEQWIDLEHPDEVLSETRLAEVAAARAQIQAGQAY
jgi:hypothetical protein